MQKKKIRVSPFRPMQKKKIRVSPLSPMQKKKVLKSCSPMLN